MAFIIASNRESESICRAAIASIDTYKECEQMMTQIPREHDKCEDMSLMLSALINSLQNHVMDDELMEFIYRCIESSPSQLLKISPAKNLLLKGEG